MRQPPWRHYRGVNSTHNSVFSLNNKNVNALIVRELSGFTCIRSLTMNSKFSIPHSGQSLVRYWNFSFIISELVQVTPDNSLAECVNLYLNSSIYASGANSTNPAKSVKITRLKLRLIFSTHVNCFIDYTYLSFNEIGWLSCCLAKEWQAIKRLNSSCSWILK